MSLPKRSVAFETDEQGGVAAAASSSSASSSSSPSWTTNSSHNQEGNSVDKQEDDKPTKIRPPTVASIGGRSSWFPKKTSKLLQHYVQFTNSASNQDKILKTIQYTLWILSRFYRNASKTVTKDALVHLSGQISWARYVNRFLGLPAAMEAAQSGSYYCGDNDDDPTRKKRRLAKAMAWSMVFYYSIEHLSYLKWMTPKWVLPNRRHSRLAQTASAWSCRGWLAYIVLDIARSTLALNDNNHSKQGATTTLALDATTRRTERQQLLRNACFSLPAIHWCLPRWDTDPWLPDEWINGLMWLESILCMYQGVSNFQPS